MKHRLPPRKMRKSKITSAITLALHSSILAAALGATFEAKAVDECGTGRVVQCDSSGNPYLSGIRYESITDITLGSGVRVEPTSPQQIFNGSGFGVDPELNQWLDAVIVGTVESGASVSSSAGNTAGYAAAAQDISLIVAGDITMTGESSFGAFLRGRSSGPSTHVSVEVTGNIAAAGFAIALGMVNPGSVTISNAGSVRGSTGLAISASGSSAHIQQSGEVHGSWQGIYGGSASSLDLSNSGTVSGGEAVHLYSGIAAGSLTNTGTLSGTTVGLFGEAAAGFAYVNDGVIEGATAIRLGSGQALSNSGEIHGASGTAIAMQGSNNTVTLDTGSSIQGAIVSSGTNNALILQGAGLLDTDATGLATLSMSGQAWQLLGAGTFNAAASDAVHVETGTLTISGALSAPNGGVTIDPAATLAIGDGPASVFAVGGPASFDAGLVLQSGVDTGAPGIRNDGVLRLDHALPAYDFDSLVSGSGTIDVVSGATRITSDLSGFAGQTRVGSRLAVANALGGSLDVVSGGMLEGTGSAGDTIVNSGGTLSGREGEVFTLASLGFDPTGRLSVALGAPNTSALFNVTNDLTLDGTLDVIDTGGFGAGVYRIFDYAGTLTDNIMEIGVTPAGVAQTDISLQTGGPGQINLVSTAGVDLGFWDGSGAGNNGAVEGGDGTWNATDDNWTGSDGAINGVTNNGFAVFQGAAGDVVVDNVAGTVAAQGLQFFVDGYTLDGGDLTVGSDRMIVRVGDGTEAGAAYTATINDALIGHGQLVKTDFGTLILNGANTYDGGTDIEAGTLQIGADANLGMAGTAVRLHDAQLRTTADITSDRAFTLDGQGGVFTPAAGTTLTLDGAIGGVGELTKLGDGTLVLRGNNTYARDTLVFAGALVGDTDSIHGQLANAGVVTFDQASDGAFAGDVFGTGTMRKSGAGTLTLAGSNLLDWSVDAGTLATSAARFDGDVAVASGAALRFDAAVNEAYDGVLSGAGTFAKSGAGMLTLNGNSSAFTGATQLQAGVLRVDGALGGPVNVGAGTRLEGVGSVGMLTLANGGIVAPGDSTAHIGTLTVNGDFVGQGGTLAFNAILAGDGSPTSQLHVTGNASGTGVVQVQQLGGLGGYTAEGIRIIAIDGQSDAALTLAGRVVAGPYEYALFQGGRSTPTDGDWYLRSEALADAAQPMYRAETGAYLSNQAASLDMFRHDMRDRYGHGDVSTRLKDNDGMRPGWVRMATTQSDVTFAAASQDIAEQTSVMQIGSDVVGWGSGAVGVMAGIGRSNATTIATATNVVARSEAEGNAIGVYGTWFQNPDDRSGAYIDGWMQYARFAQSVDGMQLASEAYESHAFTYSAEAGYGFKAGVFTIEPQAQAIWTEYNGDRHVEANGTVVQGATEDVQTRFGVRTYGKFRAGILDAMPYIAFDWRHGDLGGDQMTFDGVRLSGAMPEERYEVRAGTQLAFDNGWNLWAHLTLQEGDGNDYRQFGGQVNVGYRW